MGSSVILPTPGQPKTGADPAFSTAAQPNIVSFGFDKVGPPSTLYLQRDDVLILQAASTQNGEVVRFTARFLLPYVIQPGQPDTLPKGAIAQPVAGLGTVVTVQRDVPAAVAANIFATQVTLPLAEGYLLAIAATATVAQAHGVTFARASLARRPIAPTIQVVESSQVLFADYVQGSGPVGWPGGRVVYSTENSGALVDSTLGNPAAGADWTFTFATLTRARVQNVNAQLVIANAGVARIIRVQVKDGGGNILWQSAAQQTGAINTTVQVSMAGNNVTTTSDPTTLNIGLPSPLIVAGGWTLGTSTVGINAADQWSNIRVTQEQYVDAG